MRNVDTIAAIATPAGTGAIAIVRLSGQDSVKIANQLFQGRQTIQDMPAQSVAYGKICDPESKKIIDDVLVLKFQSPASYTGQDMVEIHCHGGQYVVRKILHLLLDLGARLADPGEFTKRAFINGKMDLVQAESIGDIIQAQTEKSLALSHQQLEGQLSQTLNELQEQLREQCGLLELELDFSEDNVEFTSRATITHKITELKSHLTHLADSFQYGRIVREGAHLVIVGAPNVGKSSILNRFLQKDRAIVTATPGTTRDTIEESLDINGQLFRVSDTAGLRNTKNHIEKEGVERTRKQIEQADLLLFVIDPTMKNYEKECDYFNNSLPVHALKKLVINKIDIAEQSTLDRIAKKYKNAFYISAKTGQGFDHLKQGIAEIFNEPYPMESAVLTKTRHYNAVTKTIKNLTHAERSLQQNYSAEFIAMDLRHALDELATLTGQVTTEDILNDIFTKFCIGK